MKTILASLSGSELGTACSEVIQQPQKAEWRAPPQAPSRLLKRERHRIRKDSEATLDDQPTCPIVIGITMHLTIWMPVCIWASVCVYSRSPLCYFRVCCDMFSAALCPSRGSCSALSSEKPSGLSESAAPRLYVWLLLPEMQDVLERLQSR